MVVARSTGSRARLLSCLACSRLGSTSRSPVPSLRALRRLQREQAPGRYVFMSERGAPMSPSGFRRMFVGKVQTPFGIHPHMLRHACGFKLANDGHDTRSMQHYLGHKNIHHTVRYTELSPDRFREFWATERRPCRRDVQRSHGTAKTYAATSITMAVPQTRLVIIKVI